MQRKKNDVKARTTLLLSLPDEHWLRFSNYKTAKELWATILKTFGGNEATKKRKKNLLKQQYGNFKAEGSETLEQTFNRLQVIDVAKLKAKGDIGVFVGYSKESAAFRIYNKRTRKIHESVNVDFDEISEMDFKQFSLEPGLSNLNEIEKSSNPSVLKVSEVSENDLEDLFQDFYDEYFDSSKIM
nr:ribonuclease H-like domain-containing protein [Tanacetum cinerariifolium]